MRHLAQKKPVYSAVVCSLESGDDQKDVSDDHTVEAIEDKTKTPYLKEV